MISACLFPGLNTIAKERDRSRFLALPTVQKYISRLQPFGYTQWLSRPAGDLYNASDIAALAAISLAIQTGTFEYLCNTKFKPDLLIGCSSGDLSRTVCSGALDFEDAVNLIANFGDITGNINSGVTYSVWLPSRQHADKDLINELRDSNIDPSVFSNRHLIIGCDREGEETLITIAKDKNWQIKKSPFHLALHSRHIIPYFKILEKNLDLNLRNPRIPVFSTYNLDVITTASGLVKEAYQCFCKPLHWVNSLRQLQKEFHPQHYINIGPCNSLPVLLRETDLDIKMENVRL